MKLTKIQILKIADIYDRFYRGGTGRGDIDEKLATLISWVLNQKKLPTNTQIENRVNKF